MEDRSKQITQLKKIGLVNLTVAVLMAYVVIVGGLTGIWYSKYLGDKIIHSAFTIGIPTFSVSNLIGMILEEDE